MINGLDLSLKVKTKDKTPSFAKIRKERSALADHIYHVCLWLLFKNPLRSRRAFLREKL